MQDELKNDCQIIEFKDEYELAKKEYTLTPMPFTRENWQRIFKTTLDDLTTLLAPQEIIYCEGKLNLSLDEKMFNDIFSHQYPNVLFISSTSKSESQRFAGIALTILNKAFTGVKIKVLIDRDDDLSTPTLSNVDIRKLKRREFENYLCDWEIVNKSYAALVKDRFDAICTDIINDNIKSKTKILMNVCGEKKENKFQLTLANNFSSDTSVYKELEKIIFN